MPRFGSEREEKKKRDTISFFFFCSWFGKGSCCCCCLPCQADALFFFLCLFYFRYVYRLSFLTTRTHTHTKKKKPFVVLKARITACVTTQQKIPSLFLVFLLRYLSFFFFPPSPSLLVDARLKSSPCFFLCLLLILLFLYCNLVIYCTSPGKRLE